VVVVVIAGVVVILLLLCLTGFQHTHPSSFPLLCSCLFLSFISCKRFLLCLSFYLRLLLLVVVVVVIAGIVVILLLLCLTDFHHTRILSLIFIIHSLQVLSSCRHPLPLPHKYTHLHTLQVTTTYTLNRPFFPLLLTYSFHPLLASAIFLCGRRPRRHTLILTVSSQVHSFSHVQVARNDIFHFTLLFAFLTYT